MEKYLQADDLIGNGIGAGKAAIGVPCAENRPEQAEHDLGNEAGKDVGSHFHLCPDDFDRCNTFLPVYAERGEEADAHHEKYDEKEHRQRSEDEGLSAEDRAAQEICAHECQPCGDLRTIDQYRWYENVAVDLAVVHKDSADLGHKVGSDEAVPLAQSLAHRPADHVGCHERHGNDRPKDYGRLEEAAEIFLKHRGRHHEETDAPLFRFEIGENGAYRPKQLQNDGEKGDGHGHQYVSG